jgi:hypothetical protein
MQAQTFVNQNDSLNGIGIDELLGICNSAGETSFR